MFKILGVFLVGILLIVGLQSQLTKEAECGIDAENALVLEGLEPDVNDTTQQVEETSYVVVDNCNEVDSLTNIVAELTEALQTQFVNSDTQVVEVVEKINLLEGKGKAYKQLFLFIHCTATKEGQKVSPENINRIAKMRFGINRRTGKHWKSYHYIVDTDGSIFYNHYDDTPGWITVEEIYAGAKGFNSYSKHAVYIGGVDAELKAKDTRTDYQRTALANLIRYELSVNPDLRLVAHHSVTAKACPSFKLNKFATDYGIDESKILNNLNEVENYLKSFKRKELSRKS